MSFEIDRMQLCHVFRFWGFDAQIWPNLFRLYLGEMFVKLHVYFCDTTLINSPYILADRSSSKFGQLQCTSA